MSVYVEKRDYQDPFDDSGKVEGGEHSLKLLSSAKEKEIAEFDIVFMVAEMDVVTGVPKGLHPWAGRDHYILVTNESGDPIGNWIIIGEKARTSFYISSEVEKAEDGEWVVPRPNTWIPISSSMACRVLRNVISGRK